MARRDPELVWKIEISTYTDLATVKLPLISTMYLLNHATGIIFWQGKEKCTKCSYSRYVSLTKTQCFEAAKRQLHPSDCAINFKKGKG
ncbi:hypothetical protein TNCV_1207811 [Trichonephila clavipes]|nr:hypothetical protein TNCV_1207811 [Trichonephila clavipes]